MSKELSPQEFEAFRWYIAAHYLRMLRSDPANKALNFATGTHLLFMLGEIEGGAGSVKDLGPQAANRWIGFVQGVLFQAGVSGIDGARAITTDCMEKAAIHQHVTIEPGIGGAWVAVIYGDVVHTFDIDGHYEDINAELAGEKMRIVETLFNAGWQRMPSPEQNADQAQTRAAIAQARKILTSASDTRFRVWFDGMSVEFKKCQLPDTDHTPE